MQLLARIIGMLLIVVVAASSVGAQALLLPSGQDTLPAPCHGHGSHSPAPAPAGHQCCIAGHDHAVPGNSFSGLTLLPYFGAIALDQPVASLVSFTTRLSVLTNSTPGSPGSISLRI